MRRKWILGGALVTVAVLAIGAAFLMRRHPPAQAVRAQAPAPPPVSDVSLSGKIQAVNVLDVPAPIEGSIDEFYKDVGQEVYEGELIARLKNTTLESARDQASAELERAQSRAARLESSLVSARLEASRARADAIRSRGESERLEKLFLRQQLLYREGATPRLVFEKSQKDYQEAHAEYTGLGEVAKQAEERVEALTKELDAARRVLDDRNQDLEQAKADLAATEVHSPVDGLVVARRGAVGEEVNRNMKDLFQIAVDLSVLAVVVNPEPPLLDRIKPGAPVLVEVAEVGGEGLAGVVKDVKDGRVVVEFRNPSPAVKPGLTAQVVIKLT